MEVQRVRDARYSVRGAAQIGPRDIAENQAVLVRRDTHEKITVSLDEIYPHKGCLASFWRRFTTVCLSVQSAQRFPYALATTLDEMKEIIRK